jgi:hypothetical protein
MLRHDVVAAVEAGRFAVYPVSHVDEGIELLTGITAGTRDTQGLFPEASINRLVEDRLVQFSTRLLQLGKEQEKGNASNPENQP